MNHSDVHTPDRYFLSLDLNTDELRSLSFVETKHLKTGRAANERFLVTHPWTTTQDASVDHRERRR
ncbi:hypothetical protein BN903_85 [Halorubrum sp. AJ67]|nr:hypothetical protein BN903_85 [Halorubrum sp. AJ67]